MPRPDMGTSASPYGFVMFDTNADSTLDLAYIADDRASTGGGLQKWTLSGTSWSKSWSLLVGPSGTSILQPGPGTGFAGLRGLAGTWDAVSGASLFATTTETSNNRLLSILDTGLTTPSTYTLLAQAGSNFVFRGVDLSPMVSSSSAVPEIDPAGVGAVLALVAGACGVFERRRPRAKAV